MRTLTVYVVRHADDAPMDVFPTMKAANAFLLELRKDNGGEPLCPEWRAESRTFQDNSTGVATMMSWLLAQCADELVDGFQAHSSLESSRGIVNILSRALAHHGQDPDQIVLNASDADRADPEVDAADLAVATPEHLH